MTRTNQKKPFRDNSENTTKLLCDEALNHVKVSHFLINFIKIIWPIGNWANKSHLFQGQNYVRALTTYNKVKIYANGIRI